jgi:hypothetical protein
MKTPTSTTPGLLSAFAYLSFFLAGLLALAAFQPEYKVQMPLLFILSGSCVGSGVISLWMRDVVNLLGFIAQKATQPSQS